MKLIYFLLALLLLPAIVLAQGSGQEHDSSKKLAFSPAFGLEKVVTEVSGWYRKEPWMFFSFRFWGGLSQF